MTAAVITFPKQRRFTPVAKVLPIITPVVLNTPDLPRVEIFAGHTAHELNNLSDQLEKLAERLRTGERLIEEGDAA